MINQQEERQSPILMDEVSFCWCQRCFDLAKFWSIARAWIWAAYVDLQSGIYSGIFGQYWDSMIQNEDYSTHNFAGQQDP